MQSEVFGLGLNLTFLTDLKPNVFYRVKMRCGTAQHFWKWGDWSKSVGFHTKTDGKWTRDDFEIVKENPFHVHVFVPQFQKLWMCGCRGAKTRLWSYGR